MRAARRAGLLRNFRRYERKVMSVMGRSSVRAEGVALYVSTRCG